MAGDVFTRMDNQFRYHTYKCLQLFEYERKSTEEESGLLPQDEWQEMWDLVN